MILRTGLMTVHEVNEKQRPAFPRSVYEGGKSSTGSVATSDV